ncbi:MAG: glucose 1-dehydrogenase [Ruminiclostridium sp.]|nr:glucose 1-dehydrogenase [Ruminiclostridium sp.]
MINRCGLEYKDKVVLITGGSKGIGAGCAEVFADAGSKVVICARSSREGEKLADELTFRGPGRCSFVYCNVSKTDDIIKVVDRTIDLYGHLDCLINNAGYHFDHRPVDDFTTDEFNDILQTNLLSCFTASKAALPHIRKVKGNIINMGSLVGSFGQQGASMYCATKGAILSFTKALAIEEGRNGVRVNCVAPGIIKSNSFTEFLKNSKDSEKLEKWCESQIILGRVGTIYEVAQLCLFLASDAASYLTGIEIIISGGAELDYGNKYPLTLI